MVRFPFPWIEIERQRAEFLRERESYTFSEERFITSVIENPTRHEATVVRALLRFVARDCAIAPEKLSPHDRIAELDRLMGGSGFLAWLLSMCENGFSRDAFFIGLVSELEAMTGRDVRINKNVTDDAADAWNDRRGMVDAKKTVAEWMREATYVILRGLRELGDELGR